MRAMISRIGLICLLAFPATLQAADKGIADVFKKVNPAVVVVHTVERRLVPQARSGEVSAPGLGSGVLISKDGLVMTAAHVVQTADQVEVEFLSGEKTWAKVVTSSPWEDLALLHLEAPPKKIRPARIGDSDQVEIGDPVFVVGTPYGLSHSLSAGHISARHGGDHKEGAPAGLPGELFQTDAAINQGNSGGPMFNADGEVIGIVSHILSKSGGFEGLGFAITSNEARRVLLEERVLWTGMSGILLKGQLASALQVPEEAGYLVQRVAHNSPAERIGLRPGTIPAVIDGRPLVIGGDIILDVNGIPIAGDPVVQRTKIFESLQAMSKGDKVVVRVLRGGRRTELSDYVLE